MAIDLSPRQNGPEWPNHMLKRVCAGFFCKQGSEFEMSMAVSDVGVSHKSFFPIIFLAISISISISIIPSNHQ